ncbi:mgpp2cl-1, protein phosphatase 2C-like protein 1 [Naganishia albida]|nr:mgpp2cl-1, protein phosphatase 2C-like protein 1 [Naganishia albida]
MSQSHDAPPDPNVGPLPGHGASVEYHSHNPDAQAKDSLESQSDMSARPTEHLNPPSQFDPSSLARRRSPKQANKDLHLNTEEANRLAAEREHGSEGHPRRPGALSSDADARSKTVTMADGENTFGALNRHPGTQRVVDNIPTFRVGVSEDKNRKCRRSMEDAHSFVYDFGGVKGQGYFAIFDGHAGKHAAEWCGQNFHEYLLDALITDQSTPIPDLMNQTFHTVDARITQISSEDHTHSGCTAVTAFLRLEEADERKPDEHSTSKGFVNPDIKARGLMEGKGEEQLEELTRQNRGPASLTGSSAGIGGAAAPSEGSGSEGGASVTRKPSTTGRLKNFMKGLAGARDSMLDDETEATPPTQTKTPTSNMPIADGRHQVDLFIPKSEKGLKRVLYTANVGDARAVLCRGGKAVRLTYDHKGSDAQEAKRITDAGGFVMNNRVNGVLAVTRSLGDSSMKEFVVGAPYTTETTLDDDDEFLIVACDGLWDVTEDQEAVDLIRNKTDPQEASKILMDHAIQNYSTDNLSVMVIRFGQA